MRDPGTVAIVGAGLGGLALAQSLTRRGIDCDVYERDRSLAGQGRSVRIHCRPSALAAARRCVPAPVLDALVASQSARDARHLYLDAQLDVTDVDRRPEPEVVFDTQTAREVLALGLGDRLRLGRELAGIERVGGRLGLRFADGASAPADVVVGADGAGSTVRGLVADPPIARDVGLWSVYGNVDLDERPGHELPAWLREGFAIVVDDPLKIALGLYEPVAATVLEQASIRPRRFLFWNVLAPPGAFGPAAPAWDAATAVRSIARLVAHLPRWLAETVARSTPLSLGFLALQTSAPAAGPVDGRVVLIGDAAHPMLPAALSASVALEDAHRLGAALADGDPGEAIAAMQAAAFERVREAELLAAPAFGLEAAIA